MSQKLFLPRYRPATRERYVALTGQGIFDVLGETRIDVIGLLEDRRFAASLAARGIQERGPRGFLRTLLRAAVETKTIERMPDLAPAAKQSKKLPDAPTREEVEAMLGASTGWLRTAIVLAAFAGLRLGEVCALEVRDVDFVRGLLLVRRAVSGNEVLTPKSGHERVVPLAPVLRDELVAATRDKLPHARIVFRPNGKTPCRQHVLAALKTMLAKNGLGERSFHSLRHAFCSTLIRGGASVEAVRLLAGHSDLATTQRYVHANPRDLELAIATLGGRR